MPLEPGALFASRYEILGAIGRGGMGMVYKVRDHNLNEVVALKILRPDVALQSPGIERRFRSEIRLARRVRHRNVCSIFGDGEYRGLLFIAMELVEGTDLSSLVRGRGGMPATEAYDVCLQIGEGLRAIHDAGVIHRDLKTANIMRDKRGVVRVMDFGIAKQHAHETAEVAATASGRLMGTPEYMSPEQIRGGTPVDFRTDLYSFGIVIFELFVGRVPFRGDTPVQTLVQHLSDPPPLSGPQSASLPPALAAVLAKTLAKAPCDRFASAGDLLVAINRAREETDFDALRARPSVSLDELAALPTRSQVTAPSELRDALPGTARPRTASLLNRRRSAALALAAGAAATTYFYLPASPRHSVAESKAEASIPASAPSGTVNTSVPVAGTLRTARLTLAVNHTVQSGMLRLFVDKVQVLEKPLAASNVRRALIFKGRKSELVEVIDVAPGEHTLRIEVEEGGGKKSGQIAAAFRPAQSRLLEVTVLDRVELEWR